MLDDKAILICELLQFNRAMRMKANVLGYSLNQRGLYAGVVRDPCNRRVKVSAGAYPLHMPTRFVSSPPKVTSLHLRQKRKSSRF